MSTPLAVAYESGLELWAPFNTCGDDGTLTIGKISLPHSGEDRTETVICKFKALRFGAEYQIETLESHTPVKSFLEDGCHVQLDTPYDRISSLSDDDTAPMELLYHLIHYEAGIDLYFATQHLSEQLASYLLQVLQELKRMYVLGTLISLNTRSKNEDDVQVIIQPLTNRLLELWGLFPPMLLGPDDWKDFTQAIANGSFITPYEYQWAVSVVDSLYEVGLTTGDSDPLRLIEIVDTIRVTGRAAKGTLRITDYDVFSEFFEEPLNITAPPTKIENKGKEPPALDNPSAASSLTDFLLPSCVKLSIAHCGVEETARQLAAWAEFSSIYTFEEKRYYKIAFAAEVDTSTLPSKCLE
jgi:hypothetical protein